jgi:hypothetical protein
MRLGGLGGQPRSPQFVGRATVRTMHISASEDPMTRPDEGDSWCAACGGHLHLDSDRTFALDPERDLCFTCSLERGGEYEQETDRWVVPPLDPAIDLRDERR